MVTQAFERAVASPPPLCAMGYEDPRVRLLVGFCRELQREQREISLRVGRQGLNTENNTEGHPAPGLTCPRATRVGRTRLSA